MFLGVSQSNIESIERERKRKKNYVIQVEDQSLLEINLSLKINSHMELGF